LRRIDDRRKRGPTNAAQTRDGEAAALHLGGSQFPGAGLLGQLAEYARYRVDILAVRIVDDRHDQPIGCIGSKPNMDVLLENKIAALGVQRSVEQRKLLQRPYTC